MANGQTKTAVLILFLLLSLASFAKDEIFEDYKIDEFSFQGHGAKVVFPNIKPNGEWVWRARFWGHEPQTDKALLDKGFHIVYVDVADLFGNQQAVELWNDYYAFCREKYALNQKVVLEGMSRGGLIIYNWASQNVDKVACIYADAPVCDIKSWPGGLYKGVGSPQDWANCLEAHHLDEQSVLDFKGIPIHTAAKVARAGIPVLHVCGDSDEVVPFEENTALLAKIFEENGGELQLILKKGIGHHPHSLENPKPIVNFILTSTLHKKMSAKTIYWATTLLISIFLLWSAYTYIFSKPTIEGVSALGFPDHLRVQLAVLKIVAVLLLLIPQVPIQAKEWAYAGVGLFFITAIVAHTAHKDPIFISLINAFLIAVLIVSNSYLHKLTTLT